MSYDPYSWICIPIHYAPVELKIGTQRGATESHAACGTSKEGGSRNDKSKASCLACPSLPPAASPLPFREPYANRARLNGEQCNGPGKERSITSEKTFRAHSFSRTRLSLRMSNVRIRSAKAVCTDVLNCVQTNHFGTMCANTVV